MNKKTNLGDSILTAAQQALDFARGNQEGAVISQFGGDIYQLEQSLLDPKIRKSATELDKLISDDFIEFGSSGKVYSKQDIVDHLPEEDDRKFEVSNFSVKDIAEDVVLATYIVAVDGASSLRASLWSKKSGKWQMTFHQGTLIQ